MSMVHSAQERVIPTCAAVLMAALLSGCSVQKVPEREPDRFEVVSRTWREGFSNNPTTSALIADRQTGCLYSLAEGKGAAPLLTPDGAHAGCTPTTANSVGMSEANAPTPPVKTGEG